MNLFASAMLLQRGFLRFEFIVSSWLPNENRIPAYYFIFYKQIRIPDKAENNDIEATDSPKSRSEVYFQDVYWIQIPS